MSEATSDSPTKRVRPAVEWPQHNGSDGRLWRNSGESTKSSLRRESRWNQQSASFRIEFENGKVRAEIVSQLAELEQLGSTL